MRLTANCSKFRFRNKIGEGAMDRQTLNYKLMVPVARSFAPSIFRTLLR